MTRFSVALLTFLLMSLSAASAFACKCERNIDPIKGSKMVFWGKATQITPRGSQDRVEFEISKLYKGDERPNISVYANRFNHDCGMRFEVDKTYMVYATDFYPRGVATGVCWGTYEAAEAVADDDWQKLKVKVADETKLEKELRKVATKLVPPCGNSTRVSDAGFEIIFSPTGDPVRPPPADRVRARTEQFQQCVAEAFLASDDMPKLSSPARLVGWLQREVKRVPVLLDELPCGENCPDWTTRVKSALLDPDGPTPEGKVEVDLKAEFDQCIAGGIEAVGPESFGTESHKQQRNRMLADCAGFRGEFPQLEPYMGSVEDEAIKLALEWASAKPKGEGSIFPIGSGDPTFPALWMKAAGKPTPGRFRILRSHFLADSQWAESPVYLEAFAESIVADDAAPDSMRAYAALAYHRAGILVPAAAEAYGKLADKASSSAEAKALREQLSAEVTKLNAPPVEEVVEEEVVEAEVEEAEPEENSGQDPTLLVVAGVLILVAVAGIGTILKRRK